MASEKDGDQVYLPGKRHRGQVELDLVWNPPVTVTSQTANDERMMTADYLLDMVALGHSDHRTDQEQQAKCSSIVADEPEQRTVVVEVMAAANHWRDMASLYKIVA